MSVTRRDFLKTAGLLSAAAGASREIIPARSGALHLATNQYPWGEFYRREGRNLSTSLDTVLGEVSAAGIDGFEPLTENTRQIESLIPLLEKHRLEMRSFYVNSSLHEPNLVEESIDRILELAESASRMGARVIVTNPSPIRWGGPENKDDRQLEVQAEALNRLGRELKSRGLQLAYHNHDSELRQAAREFHHMMMGTDPSLVHLCLDAHWIYRGTGNSSVALFDAVGMYADRIVEVHIRQSQNGVWTEVLQEGDIDYRRLVAELLKRNRRPHLVLEQAVERGSPRTMNALQAHRKTVAYARDIFGPLAE